MKKLRHCHPMYSLRYQ